MKMLPISRYPSRKYQFDSWGIEDAFYNSKLTYSMRQLSFTGSFSTDIII